MDTAARLVETFTQASAPLATTATLSKVSFDASGNALLLRVRTLQGKADHRLLSSGRIVAFRNVIQKVLLRWIVIGLDASACRSARSDTTLSLGAT